MAISLKDVSKLILAIILPPLGVYLEKGWGAEVMVCVVLTLLGYLPGVIHALYILLKNKGQTYIPQPPPPQYSPPGQTLWTPPSGSVAPMYEPPASSYAPQHVIVQQQPQPPQQTILVMGGCTHQQIEDEFTCCGILCCILFFPLGIICLFAMMDKRCTNCGATF